MMDTGVTVTSGGETPKATPINVTTAIISATIRRRASSTSRVKTRELTRATIAAQTSKGDRGDHHTTAGALAVAGRTGRADKPAPRRDTKDCLAGRAPRRGRTKRYARRPERALTAPNASRPGGHAPKSGEPHEIAQATGEIRAAHRQETTPLQRMVDRVTAVLGAPGFVAGVCVAAPGWMVVNGLAAKFGIPPPDPPPFTNLQGAASVGALLMTALILTTQRREDLLADHRAQLILELSISNDQKISKVIELLEEVRRDNPAIEDRVDAEATAMSTPSDTRAVLDAIKETSEGGE